MVESIISRVSLLDLVVEILEHKGPLPIGEVGKALAELTCIAGLSLRLKEKYGGLKKFLEEYSPTIIIGNDHPFNPHVVLRCSLTADQQSMVDRGQFPTQAVIKMKKVDTATTTAIDMLMSIYCCCCYLPIDECLCLARTACLLVGHHQQSEADRQLIFIYFCGNPSIRRLEGHRSPSIIGLQHQPEQQQQHHQ
jgi:hypothetical protein